MRQTTSNELWSYARCHDIDIVPIYSLAAFSTDEERDMERLVAPGKELRNAKKIILDLRGNGGGDSDIARRFLENLNSSETMNLNYAKLNTQGSRLAEISIFAEPLDDYKKRKDKILLDPVCKWQRSEPHPVGEALYRDQLVVLTDRNTASSAEIMVKCIKDNIPQSVIIGENTSGTLNTGDIRYYYLPNSLIFLEIPTAIFAGIFDEGTGFYPDFWCMDDAMKAAIEWLSEAAG